MSDVYTRLREFMDKMPIGYPETPTGVEIKILKKLYTPEEAELTMKLKNEPEEVPATAKRLGVNEKDLAEKLEEMAQKGLIYRVQVRGQDVSTRPSSSSSGCTSSSCRTSTRNSASSSRSICPTLV